ncbi:hypothetical protein [Lysobacter enzymogenes]|uniref:hypothetical protein n=1 Tax=Lysobacter enzymogenes TaxID=69 RepID=UPI001A965114|nr:hypothetical protein [Lysobacter enzymogenes]QQP94898.1 hypothetical protein JHW38_16800 [Lysobacter enzymogenes]
MRQSRFWFDYDRADLRRIRPLRLTLYAALALGAVAGYYGLEAPKAFDRLWTGLVLAFLPGYLVGCAVQWLLRPQRFAEHGRIIAWLGLISAFTSAVGVSALL